MLFVLHEVESEEERSADDEIVLAQAEIANWDLKSHFNPHAML